MIDSWTVKGTWTINNDVVIDPLMDMPGDTGSALIIETGATVKGGVNALDLGTGTYQWNNAQWELAP